MVNVGFLERIHGRAPQGARGLKYLVDNGVIYEAAVAPRKGRVE